MAGKLAATRAAGSFSRRIEGRIGRRIAFCIDGAALGVSGIRLSVAAVRREAAVQRTAGSCVGRRGIRAGKGRLGPAIARREDSSAAPAAAAPATAAPATDRCQRSRVLATCPIAVLGRWEGLGIEIAGAKADRSGRYQCADDPPSPIARRSHRPMDEQHGTCHRIQRGNPSEVHARRLPWRSRLAQPGTRAPCSLSQGEPRDSPPKMSATAAAPKSLPPKLRRALELVYAVEGVIAARIWHWPGRIAVGVRGGSASSPTDLLRRVEIAVASLREPEESWDFGILEDESSRSPQPIAPPEPEGSASLLRRSPRSQS